MAQDAPISESACIAMADAGERLLCFDQLARQSKWCSNVEEPAGRLVCYDNHALEQGLTTTMPEDQSLNAVERRRVAQERAAANDNPWLIAPHRQTYLLPFSYLFSGVNSDPFGELAITGDDEQHPRDYEAKYQISFAIPLWRHILGHKSELRFGYTQVSVWQIYSSENSSPFRDTNYEPELIWRTPVGAYWGDLSFDTFQVSFDHQSNGRTDPLSRSWNRIIATMSFSTDDWVVALRPWYRLPEDAEDDNNPDIEDYLGYGEFWSWYKGGRHTLGLMLRNNFRSDDNRTTVQLDWSFPIHPKLKGYAQYFNGYGETLVDYRFRNERLGIGIMLLNIF